MTSTSARVHGLDTLRAAAIALVFAYHYEVFASREATFGVVSEIGWAGVDLFFVLSGYLIGRQLFRPLAAGQPLGLGRFYLRRALRTLPNYWVVLALFLLWPAALGGVPRTPAWQFLTFTQNFGLQAGSVFSHAWSLCIEEQFYLLMPLALLVCAAIGRMARAAWVLLVGGVLACTVARAVLWQAHGAEPGAYMTHIYYASVCRFDELLPGVALALLREAHPQAWQRLRAHGLLTFLLGLACTVAVLAWFHQAHQLPGGGFAFGPSVLGYPALAAGFALLTLSALSPASPLQRWRVPGAASLATASYALYLVHKPVISAAKPLLRAWALDPRSAAGVALLIALSLLATAVLHLAVERPFLRWRERRFPAATAGTPLAPERENQPLLPA